MSISWDACSPGSYQLQQDFLSQNNSCPVVPRSEQGAEGGPRSLVFLVFMGRWTGHFPPSPLSRRHSSSEVTGGREIYHFR